MPSPHFACRINVGRSRPLCRCISLFAAAARSTSPTLMGRGVLLPSLAKKIVLLVVWQRPSMRWGILCKARINRLPTRLFRTPKSSARCSGRAPERPGAVNTPNRTPSNGSFTIVGSMHRPRRLPLNRLLCWRRCSASGRPGWACGWPGATQRPTHGSPRPHRHGVFEHGQRRFPVGALPDHLEDGAASRSSPV